MSKSTVRLRALFLRAIPRLATPGAAADEASQRRDAILKGERRRVYFMGGEMGRSHRSHRETAYGFGDYAA